MDWLLDGSGVEGDEDVVLISMGSPYRRLFVRFFPGVLFHLDPTETANAIAARVQRLRWLNVYRPWDYIGASLGLTRSGVGLDRSTRQWSRLEGHGNYWGDNRVLEVIEDALDDLISLRASPSAATSTPYYPQARALPDSALEADPIGRATWILIGSMCVWLAFSIVSREQVLATERDRIRAEGERHAAIATHNRYWLPSGHAGQYSMHRFELAIPGLEIEPVIIDPNNPFSGPQRQLDHRKLIDTIREDCRLAFEDTWYTRELDIPCTSNRKLVVVVLAGDPTSIFLPCCPPKLYLRDLPGWLFGVVFLGFWLAGVSSPAIAAFTAVYLAFMGHSVSGVDWNFEP